MGSNSLGNGRGLDSRSLFSGGGVKDCLKLVGTSLTFPQLCGYECNTSHVHLHRHRRQRAHSSAAQKYQIYDKMGDLIIVRGWFMVKSLDFILSAL